MDIKKILKESIWIYTFIFIAAFAGYFVRVLYARNFSVVEYGLFYSVFSFIFLLRPLREFGFGASHMFYMNKYLSEKEYGKAKGVFIIALVSQIVLAVAVSVVVFLLKPYLVVHFFRNPLANDIINVLLLYSIFQLIVTSVSHTFGSFRNNFMFQLRDPLIGIFVFVFTLLFFKLNFAVMTAPYAHLFAGIFALLVYLLIYKVSLRQIKVKADYDRKTAKDVFYFAFTVSIGSFAWVILSYLDTTLITWIKGLESVGYYNVVLPSMQIVFLLTNPMLNILFTESTSMFHMKKDSQLSTLVSFIYNNFLIFTLPLASIMFVFSREIISFIFGAKYAVASIALKIYLVFWAFVFLRQINFVLLSSIGEIKFSSKMLWLEVIFNVVVGIILISFFDYTGAVFTLGIGAIIMTLLTYNFLRKKIGIRIDFIQQIKILIAGALFTLLALFLERQIFISIGKWSIIVEGIIVLAISGLVYLISLMAMKVITKEKVIFLKNLFFRKAQ